MLEIEGIGSEVVTVCVAIVVTVIIFFVTLAAWQSTARRPLYYDLFLVEMHTWVSRRFVQVLHLGQEFRPRGSWGDVMARMRSRSRRQPERESDQTLLSDTNVVIQSPATVVDGNVAILPAPNATTLWEIEMPAGESNGVADSSQDSQFAAAAAIAVLGQRVHASSSSGTVNVVPRPGTPSISPQLASNIIVPMNVSIVQNRNEAQTVEIVPVNMLQASAPPTEDRTGSVSQDSSLLNSQELLIVEDRNKNDLNAVDNITVEEHVPPSAQESEGDSVIRLKFLDDTERDARATITDTVAQFKNIHFASEVSAGRIVRLIYQGQLLRDDSRSLESYGLQDGCVVHCHVSNTPYAQPASPTISSSTLSETISRNRHTTTQRREEETVAGESTGNSELRYPRWAIALLLHTYRIPLLGAPMDALVRFLFDQRSVHQNSQPRSLIRRTYRRLHNAVFGAYRPQETVHNLDTAADAASQPRPQHICLGDYLLWIFAGQFVAVWGFVYCFPQLCDRTALGLLILLTLYFFFVVCRSREIPEQQNHRNSHSEMVR